MAANAEIAYASVEPRRRSERIIRNVVRVEQGVVGVGRAGDPREKTRRRWGLDSTRFMRREGCPFEFGYIWNDPRPGAHANAPHDLKVADSVLKAAMN